jgi:hypothetical protein
MSSRRNSNSLFLAFSSLNGLCVQMATRRAWLDYEKSVIKRSEGQTQKSSPQIYDPFLATARFFRLWFGVPFIITHKEEERDAAIAGRVEFMLREADLHITTLFKLSQADQNQ